MAKGIRLPDIPEHEQTPVVKALLGIIEEPVVTVQRQEEEIQQLKDEDDQEKEGGTSKRPGSNKKSKTEKLKIHEEKIVPPSEEIPPGSRFKGYRDFVIQDLVIRAHNVRYRLERWEPPDGQTLEGQLPESSAKSLSRCWWNNCANGQP